MLSKLHYISQGLTVDEQVENCKRILDAGCNWIQLRFKNANEKEMMVAAEQIKKSCLSYKAVFIINDKTEIAKSIDADGVHLGLTDMPVKKARAILGATKIIGGTANTREDVWARVEEKCDYIGLGPYRFTATKEKLSPVLGLNGYETMMSELSSKNIHIPVYAIGGITENDFNEIKNIGVHGIAVSGEITRTANKKKWIQNFNLMFNEKITNSL